MLFPSVGSVNHIWGLIAHATATNDLGIAAKVATDQATSDRVPRLICIYTADFADLKDVTTVLRKLVDLGVADKTMGIYYKCGKQIFLVQSDMNMTDVVLTWQ